MLAHTRRSDLAHTRRSDMLAHAQVFALMRAAMKSAGVLSSTDSWEGDLPELPAHCAETEGGKRWRRGRRGRGGRWRREENGGSGGRGLEVRLAWHTSRATPPTTWYLHLARRRVHALACLHPSLALTLGGALCVHTAGQHSGTLRGHSRDKHAAHARELQDGGQCVEQHPCRAPPAVCAGVAAQRPLCDAGTKLIKHQLWQSRRCANVLEVSVLLTTARRSTAGPIA